MYCVGVARRTLELEGVASVFVIREGRQDSVECDLVRLYTTFAASAVFHGPVRFPVGIFYFGEHLVGIVSQPHDEGGERMVDLGLRKLCGVSRASELYHNIWFSYHAIWFSCAQ